MHETQQIRPEALRIVGSDEARRIETTAGSAARPPECLMVLAAVWQAYAMFLRNDLLLPTFTATLDAFVTRTLTGELPSKALVSIKVLLQGYVIGMVLAMVLTVFAMASRLGNDLLETLTAMLNPLPAIALLPLALIWFGLGSASIVFVQGVFYPLPVFIKHLANGGPQLRPARTGLCGEDPGAGCAQQHPHWPEDRLGVRLADPDRS